MPMPAAGPDGITTEQTARLRVDHDHPDRHHRCHRHRHRHRAALLGLLMVAASGCAGPHPAPPRDAAVVAPAEWRDKPSSTSRPAATDPSRDWWRGFDEPVLDALVRQALEHNDDVATAVTRVRQADALVRLNRAAELPQIGALATGTPRSRTLGPLGEPLSFSGYFAGPLASYDVDPFGRLAKLTSAARSRLRESRALADEVRLTVAVMTVNGYLKLRADDATLLIAEQNLDAFRAEADRRRHQAAAGYGTSLAADQAASEAAEVEAQLSPLRIAVREDENQLSVLLGADPGPIPRGQAILALLPPPAPLMVPSRLLQRRPDLEAAAQEVVANDQQLDSARAAFLPDLVLQGGGGGLGADVLLHSFGVYSLTGSILAPIFQGGALRANRDLAAARRDEAAFAFRKAALSAFSEVEDALVEVSQSARREAAEQNSADSDARTLAQARRRYDEGQTDYFEVIDAERRSLASELRLVQARQARLQSVVLLFGAMGGGWTKPANREASSSTAPG